MYRIAVDVMSGEKEASELITGALRALKEEKEIELTLIGEYDIISEELAKTDFDSKRLKIENSDEIITMDESPIKALRKKKKATVNVGAKLLKKSKIDAFISPGNTGSVMAAGLLRVGRIKGVSRPPIAIQFPAVNGSTLVLDNGANTDCSPENLKQFALMGQLYAENVMKIDNPKIALLNIGEEKTKGNNLTKESYEVLSNDQRIKNFIGNVEGRDIFSNKVDVVVTDGFVGNIVLKTTEGAASFFLDLIKESFKTNLRSKIAAFLIKPYLKKVLNKIDYRQYGGAPLLGINGVVIISHGGSDGTAIYNAIKAAKRTVKEDIVKLIKAELEKNEELE
ncbi:Phosphate:acyl-ACP acyltransferase PlsX [Halanaerobium saccharolyticum subsp. saccharolyticum DSM 6643]|uniref:Phosphate acyltransferase n=1 Tax=Halanaerobium saccharolyticum subsp. saccharolyticum DSM 6643 TaxID=1293054 RepID=M5EEK8_9FIRM|nr:phosphate acyltransferase PlsX [Halanaerobium saccharolyticum]CCU79493.1 Phosphate:acyl-ACP acyltransferase PlsX [Halanaerobium saccharolyticum subsp. saccharolyticum DSM 6643]